MSAIQPIRQRNQARAIAILVYIVGAFNVYSAITPSFAGRHQQLISVVPLFVENGSRLATAFSGFALLILAQSLWRQKRMAWIIATLVLVIASVFHIFKGLDVEEASVSLGLAFILWFNRDSFFAASDEPSFNQGVRALIQATLFTLIYGIVGFSLMQTRHNMPIDLSNSFRHTLSAIGILNPTSFNITTHFSSLFADSISWIAIGTYTYALLAILRPVLIHRPATQTERSRANSIVNTYAQDGLAFIGLLSDKSYFFSKGGSVINFVVKNNVALALGNMVGPKEDCRVCLENFVAHCKKNDWIPTFYQISESFLDIYKVLGFHTIEVGREAIIETKNFTLTGSEMKPLRAPVSKLERLNSSFAVETPSHSPILIRQLHAISDEWLSTVGTREKSFSLGWFNRTYLESVKVAVVRDEKQDPVAFATLIEVPNTHEITVDLMRKSLKAPSGTMDYLFVSLIEWASMVGIERVNLGLSPLAEVGDTEKDSTTERAVRFLYDHLNRFYNFQGIHYFKHKFKPKWEPRYLAIESITQLPKIASALVKADTGDDYLMHYATLGLRSLREPLKESK